MKIKQTALSALAASALILGTASPAFATDNLSITGNGESSNNTVTVNNETTNQVVQNNDAHITNTVTSNANTGNNTATSNTNGNVTVSTGTASTTTNISNTANVNSANVSGCNTCGSNANVTISGNGENSHNDAHLNTESNNQVFQNNDANINNTVTSNSATGNNTANGNTGGNVTITTGNASTNTTINNRANANLAQIGNGNNNNTGTTSLNISGNGEGSHNDIHLDNDQNRIIAQNNVAHIDNVITSQAKTGNNTAVSNTNGMVTITTGAASTVATVDNAVNFNAASVDCCLTNVNATVSGNGENSHNDIHANQDNSLEVWQGGQEDHNSNFADINNPITLNARTGNNDAFSNTGGNNVGAFTVTTGGSSDNTTIRNQANANFFGQGPEFNFSFPQLTDNFPFNFNFDFDMGGMFDVFM